jgi:hypothetical protein
MDFFNVRLNSIWRIGAALGVIGISALGGAWWFRHEAWSWPERMSLLKKSSSNRQSEPAVPRVASVPPAGADFEAFQRYAAELRAGGWSEAAVRRRVTDQLRDSFHCQQYRAEQALGQLCYPAHYWETMPGAETLFAIEKARWVALRKLDRELDRRLKALFGPEAETVPLRRPLFGPDNFSPKLDFLTAATRENMERELIAVDPRGQISANDRLMEAERVLSGEDYALFAKWNSPTAMSLRIQLTGFKPTAVEFDAIYSWREAAASEDVWDDDARDDAWQQLSVALGAERVAEFQRTEDPNYQSAVQDLRRIGLSLDHAETLVTLRQKAADVIDAIWRDPKLSKAKKPGVVDEARQMFRHRLANVLHVPLELIPEDLI